MSPQDAGATWVEGTYDEMWGQLTKEHGLFLASCYLGRFLVTVSGLLRLPSPLFQQRRKPSQTHCSVQEIRDKGASLRTLGKVTFPHARGHSEVIFPNHWVKVN